jgi:hypothetical protein
LDATVLDATVLDATTVLDASAAAARVCGLRRILFP